jgi:hypothetical protein
VWIISPARTGTDQEMRFVDVVSISVFFQCGIHYNARLAVGAAVIDKLSEAERGALCERIGLLGYGVLGAHSRL